MLESFANERRQAPQQLSPCGLLGEFETLLVEAVEAVLADGLRRAHVGGVIGQRVTDVWREPLTILAAEELSRQYAARATRGEFGAARPVALRRALLRYSTLVTAAAEVELARQPMASMAAD